jgi:AmiR/NasT family two-component response regulator
VYQSGQSRGNSLRQALEDRQLVERAKGAVMQRVDVEEEAFRRLKKMASIQNRKLAEVVKDLLAAEEVFREIESVG